MKNVADKHFDNGKAVLVKGICKSFSGNNVIEDISLSVSPGRALCICGANSTGKTTLIRLMSGLLQPDAGSVRICGLNTADDRQKIKPLIGVVLHSSMLYRHLTVTENLMFFAGLYGLRRPTSSIEPLIERFGLGQYRDKTAGILSRGTIQRLSIARSLVHNPAVLLADEPFSSLDADAAGELTVILQDYKTGGGSLVMTAHAPDAGLYCCEQTGFLADGRIVFEPPAAETAEQIGQNGFYQRRQSN